MVRSLTYTFSEERSPWAAPVTVQPSMSAESALRSPEDGAAVQAGPAMRSSTGRGSPWDDTPAEASTPASTTACAWLPAGSQPETGFAAPVNGVAIAAPDPLRGRLPSGSRSKRSIIGAAPTGAAGEAAPGCARGASPLPNGPVSGASRLRASSRPSSSIIAFCLSITDRASAASPASLPRNRSFSAPRRRASWAMSRSCDSIVPIRASERRVQVSSAVPGPASSASMRAVAGRRSPPPVESHTASTASTTAATAENSSSCRRRTACASPPIAPARAAPALAALIARPPAARLAPAPSPPPPDDRRRDRCRAPPARPPRPGPEGRAWSRRGPRPAPLRRALRSHAP